MQIAYAHINYLCYIVLQIKLNSLIHVKFKKLS